MSRGLAFLFPTSSEKDMHNKSNIGHLVGGFNPVETFMAGQPTPPLTYPPQK